ncbi:MULTISPECIES: SdiA-regulated domain-containing protein [unclassified Pedobacter]|uniref:SdiA-regulated domain-containing protein n=1 Tax=unclassified Pedobacter TaxID=2628915 RepID=UPI0022466290|nr:MULTISPECIES: SdiA-regulated domain-containing protein [unclassified Pedobacter]MCX2429707.1 SdiA-regulated domain-containing protein [Pedobacter sp. GR22-10]MCX2585359.1 SdiA-regulated domain-containing protein [Pedobacter sp. MR22-3]
MNKNKTKLTAIITLFTVAFIGVSCVNGKHDDEGKKKDKMTTENAVSTIEKADFPYDLANPVKYNMPQNLFEISGITFHHGDPKQVFAIQDEDGDLFHLGLNDKDAQFTKFGGKGDYEDLAIINDQVIVLKSNGELHTFPISKINTPEVADVIKTKDLVPKAEYEGLASDEKAGMVYILTKEVKKGKKSDTEIFAFKFNEGTFTPAGTFKLSHQEIAAAAGTSKMNFRPSALAKNPKTGEWYILSSMNKLLVITDADFKIKSTQALKGDAFNQPEGIAFDRDNNLYISNEGGSLAAGNILMFKVR